MSVAVPAFFGGLFCMGFAVIGVIFLRFWRRSRDGLFGAFAVAFWLLAGGEAAAAFLGIDGENHEGAYLLRLVAFVLILVAIARKNASRG